MAHPPNLTAALALEADLKEAIAFGIPSRYEDAGGHEKAIAALEALVKRHDPRGRLDANWQGGVLHAFGYRATSTSGISGACSNWIRQVRAKAGV